MQNADFTSEIPVSKSQISHLISYVYLFGQPEPLFSHL